MRLIIQNLQRCQFVAVVFDEFLETGNRGFGLFFIKTGAGHFINGDFINENIGLFLNVLEQASGIRIVKRTASGFGHVINDCLFFGCRRHNVLRRDCGMLFIRVNRIQKIVRQIAGRLAAGHISDASTVIVAQFTIQSGEACRQG